MVTTPTAVKVEFKEPITVKNGFTIAASYFDANSSIRYREIRIDLREKAPSIKDPQHGVPAQNAFFVDRPDKLQGMKNALALTVKGTQDGSKILVLNGLEGMGKTQLMRQYCSLYSKDYELVFWLNIYDMATMADSFRELAINLGFDAESAKDKDKEYIFKYVCIRLEEEGKKTLEKNKGKEPTERKMPWLLLLNNGGKSVFRHLPRFGGDIIMTSCEAITKKRTAAVITIDKMNEEEAISLLLGGSVDLADADAKTIVNKLGYMPLAINLARAYIESTQISYKDYSELLNSLPLSHEENTSGQHSDALTTAWQISFEHIRKINPIAVQILEACAFLYPESIPVHLFLKEYFDLRLVSALPSSELDKEQSQGAIRTAIEVLVKLSIVTRTSRNLEDGDEDPKSDVLEMHSLIKETIYNAIDSERRVQWLKTLAAALDDATELSESTTYGQKIMGAYISHIRQLIALFKDSDHKLHNLLVRTVSYLVSIGAYTGTEELAKRSISVSEALYGPEHLYTTRCLNNLAQLYLNQGNYDEAEKFYQQARVICESKAGAEHTDTAMSLNNLAALYQSRGKYSEAETLYKQALGICQKTGSDELVAKTLCGLATFYKVQEKYDEAEQHYKEALEIQKKLFRYGHPNTATALNNLGLLYCKLGKFDEAKDLYKEALKISDKALGSKPLFTPASFRDLVNAFVKEDKSVEVKALCELVLTIDKNGLDGLYNHYRELGSKPLTEREPAFWEGLGLDMTVALNNMAGYHHSQSNKIDDAELIRNLDICKERFGPANPATVGALTKLAAFYFKQGKHNEAELRYKEALEIQEKHHLSMAASRYNLAELYRSQEKYVEAELSYKEALEIQKKHHLSMTASRYNLAELYRSQGKYVEAELLYKQVQETHEMEFGPEHSSNAIYLDSLAILYRDWKKYDEAELLYKKALEISEKAFGPKHLFTGMATNNLAALYHSQQKNLEAEKLYEQALKILKGSDPENPLISAPQKNLVLLYQNQENRDQPEQPRPLMIREKEQVFRQPQFVRFLQYPEKPQ